MSSTQPIPSQLPLVWDEAAILKNGMDFLSKKRKELALYQRLWKAAQGVDYYSPESKAAGQRVKATAIKIHKEIEALNTALTPILNEAEKTPDSDKTKKFFSIATAARLGLNYFKSVAEETYFPTSLNQMIKNAPRASNKLAFSAVVLTGATHLGGRIADFALPAYIDLLWQIPLAACVTVNAVRFLNVTYRSNPAHELIQRLKISFDSALYPTSLRRF